MTALGDVIAGQAVLPNRFCVPGAANREVGFKILAKSSGFAGG